MANQNVTQLTTQTGSANSSSLFYAVTGGTLDTGLPLSVLFNSPLFTGIPAAPTAAVNTNTTQIATTAYVINQGYLTSATAATTYAPLASPTFTGTVVIPTVTLSGGAINSTTVGATTPSTGNFTTLGTTGLATLSSLNTGAATITGGTINATTIGASTASSVRATTIVATNTITPATTSGIVGTTLADNANAGSIGEVITATATAVAQTSATLTNVTSVTLTAGDWDVWCSCTSTAATAITALNFGLTTTTGAQAPVGQRVLFGGFSSTSGVEMVGPKVRFNVSTNTTVFLTSAPTFTGTSTSGGTIVARRRR